MITAGTLSGKNSQITPASPETHTLLTLLGAAGEGIGFDKKLKVNTVKTRTHSLLNQGIFYYKCFNGFKVDEQEKILTAFNELLAEQPIWTDLFLSI